MRAIACISVTLLLLPVALSATEADFGLCNARATTPSDPLPLPQESRAELLWSYTAPQDNGDINSPRSLPDINADGLCEVVVCIYDAGYGHDDLLCFDGRSQGTGSMLWSVDSQQGASGSGGYGQECVEVISDVNGDGMADVLYGTAWGGRTFYCRSGATGALLWYLDTYDEPNSGWVYDVTAFQDITNDGIPEALAAVGKDACTLYCVDGSSSGVADVVWSFPSPDGFLSVDVLGDINGDGISEVIAGNGTNYEDDRVFCLHGAADWGGPREIWSYHTGGVVRSVIATSDINGDGKPDVLAGSSNNWVYCLSGEDGNLLWSRNMGHSVMKLALLGDMNGDGLPEVLVGPSTNAIYCLDGANGTVFWSTPTGTANGGYVWTVSSIADLDGDSLPDAIAGSFDTKVYALRGTDGLVFDTFSTGRRLYGVSSMPDLDGDGLEEILAGTQGLYGSHATLYCLSGGSFVPLRLSITQMAGRLELSWSPFDGAAAYWVHGEANSPYFVPALVPQYENRLAVLAPTTTTWLTDNGIGNPEMDWTFLVIAVNGIGEELLRSGRVGESEFVSAIP